MSRTNGSGPEVYDLPEGPVEQEPTWEATPTRMPTATNVPFDSDSIESPALDPDQIDAMMIEAVSSRGLRVDS